MRPELLETLVHLRRFAGRAEISPVLFGAAVLELCGIGDFRASDVDVIVETGEGRALAAMAGIDLAGVGESDRFRSVVHFHLDGAPLAIDVMAGMSILTTDGWLPYLVEETLELEIDGSLFRAVSLTDLTRFYRLARRAKDEAKISALEAVVGR